MSGWWQTAKVGDKVVCVTMDSRGLISVGRVYTISAMKFFPAETPAIDNETGSFVASDIPGIWVAEVRQPGPLTWFHCRRFRPVQPKSTETGFAIIKALLNTQPVREDA